MQPGSDILNKLKESSKELYTVPDGYFDSLPGQMLQKAKAEPVATVRPVISIGKRILRYAVAAVVAGIIGLGAWLWIGKPAGGHNNMAATGNDAVILQQVQNISDSEIADFIENSSLAYTGEKPATATDIDIKDDVATLMLADISDEELQQYLKQYAGSKSSLN